VEKNFEMYCKEFSGIQILSFQGRMSLPEVEEFEMTINEMIVGGKYNYILDFMGLKFISSAGLGSILSRAQQVREKGGDIRIGGCSEVVREVLHALGFGHLFKIFVDVEMALQSFVAK
jgi:anti-sigma B factor antagonist